MLSRTAVSAKIVPFIKSVMTESDSNHSTDKSSDIDEPVSTKGKNVDKQRSNKRSKESSSSVDKSRSTKQSPVRSSSVPVKKRPSVVGKSSTKKRTSRPGRPLRKGVPAQRLYRCIDNTAGSTSSSDRIFTDIQSKKHIIGALKIFKDQLNFTFGLSTKEMKQLYTRLDVTMRELLREAIRTCPTNSQKNIKLTGESIRSVIEITKSENEARACEIRDTLRENVSRVLA